MLASDGCSQVRVFVLYRAVTVVAVLVAILIASLIAWYVTKVHYTAGAYDPSVPYAVPLAYSARMQFRIPYLGLMEPILAHVDTNAQNMKMEYYGGW